MAGEGGWTTPSDLAEYAFCPRAHFYRQRYGTPPSPQLDDGLRYHRRQLRSERWRSEHPRIPWLAVLAGVALVAVAILLALP